MKKYMPALLLSVLSTSPLTSSAMPQGKWHVGAAVGASTAKISETLNIDSFGTLGRYKFNFKGAGPAGGLIAGYTFQSNKLLYGLNVGGYKDFYVARNQGKKTDVLQSLGPINSKNDLKRKYTLELAGKLGYMVDSQAHLYGKAGVVRSAFREQYSDAANDLRHTVSGWGGTVGLGLQKALENDLNVGLEYAYQYYEKLGTKFIYGGGGDVVNKSKFRPQYHNVFLTISKSF